MKFYNQPAPVKVGITLKESATYTDFANINTGGVTPVSYTHLIETQTTQMVEDFAQRIQSQGITLEQYFQFTGLTAEKMMEDMRPQAIKRIETRLVLEAVAKAENIEITDEKIDEELAKMAESYNMEVEKLKEFMGENEKKQMKEDLAVQEAFTFLVENAVEK